jgi:hypothetical protein
MFIGVPFNHFELEWPFMRTMFSQVWLKLHHMLDKQLFVMLGRVTG